MNSKEQIKYDLEQIASSHDMSGEAIDLIIDLLTYTLYHEQIEITSTAKEMSLNDAALINSKIALCCNNMYSVYRGRNPRVTIKATINSIINKNKFDKLYESNSFKLYASHAFTYNQSEGIKEIECIISKNDIVNISHKVTKDDIYYIDIKDPNSGNLLKDLSEDIVVGIINVENNEDREYQTTRIFSDHCRSFGSNEKIFVLTIPDYGIRLYKKDKFHKDDTVYVKVLRYTTLDDINESELNKINIPGTVTQVYDESTELKYKLTDAVHRQDSDSLHYDVNYAGRVHHEIQSNSDVAYLFNEVFIDQVITSSYDYVADPTNRLNDVLYIYYIERPGVGQLDPTIDNFKTQYCSYFIERKIEIEPAIEVPIRVIIDIVTEDSSSVYDGVAEVLTKYSYKLNQKLSKPQLVSEISKIDHVKYVYDLALSSESDIDFDKPGLDKYYTFTPVIRFLQDYEGTNFDDQLEEDETESEG